MNLRTLKRSRNMDGQTLIVASDGQTVIVEELEMTMSNEQAAALVTDKVAEGEACTGCKVDKWHYHEALHTTYVLREMLEAHISQHPAVMHDKKLSHLCDMADSAIGELYQAIGAIDYDKL